METNEVKNSENGIMDRDNQMILSLLTALEDDPNLTQKDLATRFGVAVGLVNSYLKRVIYKGYVKTTHLERRRLQYLLTPTGIKEKTRLTYEFLKYSYQYIHQVRNKVRDLLIPLVKQGKINIVFYGSGEVAELAYLAVREVKANLVAIIDPEAAGKRCVDHAILDTPEIEKIGPFDVILVLTKNKKLEDETVMAKIAASQHVEIISCL